MMQQLKNKGRRHREEDSEQHPIVWKDHGRNKLRSASQTGMSSGEKKRKGSLIIL